MKKSGFLLIILSLFQINGLFAQQSYQILQESLFNEPVLTSGVLTASKTFTLNQNELKRLTTESPSILSLSIPNSNGGTFEISLQKTNVLSNAFSVKTPTATINNLDYGVHYGGKLSNDAKSLVAFSFYKHCLFGIIATDAGNFNLVFLRDENKNPSQRYVLYNDRDLTIPNTFKCGTDVLPTIKNEQQFTQKAGGSTCRELTQYLECDYRMYQDNGSSIQNTLSWTTAMFNVMSYIYHNESINLKISEIFVWDQDDPYTNDAGAALGEFGDARQNNFNGDLAHFFTTLPSGNGGLAWLNVICAQYDAGSSYGPYAYSNINDAFSNLPLYSWTVMVTTHETGHNIGSPHTQWCGWEHAPGFNAAIDSCYQTEEYNGNSCYDGPEIGRTGTIMSYCHLTGNVNLNLGFGPLPGNLIRERVSEADCLTSFPGPDMPVVSGNTQYCTGETIALNATFSGGNISWSGPNGFTSTSGIVAIPNSVTTNTGMYVATVTDANCSSSEFINIQVSNKPNKPSITQSGNRLRCVPSSSAFTYHWFAADGTPVGTDSLFFMPFPSGQFYVLISRNGCFSEASEIFNFEYTSFASIDENSQENEINIWPNPAVNEINISHAMFQNNNAVITIYDLSGRIVNQKNITKSNLFNVDVSNLSNSVYTLEIKVAEQLQRAKFIVNK